MKSIFNLSKGILSVALISVAFASCSEDTMDNINKDKECSGQIHFGGCNHSNRI